MKKLLFFIATSMVMISYAQTESLTREQWQDDLKFLQETVHKDYSFLFKKTTAKKFDKAVKELHNQIPSLEEHQIVVELAKLVASFKYGHTVLGFRYQPHKFHQLPLNLYHFNDGVYIQGVHKDYENVLGAKVLGINGMAIEKAMEAVYPVVPAENEQFFKAYFGAYLTIPEVMHTQGIIGEMATEVEYTLEKEGKEFNQVFKTLPKGERVPTQYSLVKQEGDWLDAREQINTPNYLKNLEKIYYYEYLPNENTVYVRHSQIQHEEGQNTEAFYKEVFDYIENNNVDKLIIDVRLNSGGNNYFNRPVIKEIIRSDKINQVGNLVVIIGRRTFSACQNLVNEMSNYTNAVFIGEPTSENINFYGDNQRVELPNSKIPAYLSFAWWQDKAPWEGGEWLAPHIAVDMSFEEYKNNEDPVLKTALDFSDNDYVLDPMTYMTNLFMSGEIEKLKSEAAKMVKDERYQYFDFQGQFNRAGYNLLGDDQIQQAIFVFQMITDLYPKSANAWDSLAEGYLKAGDKAKATEYYNKAIALDPEGRVGANAREMLRTMNEH